MKRIAWLLLAGLLWTSCRRDDSTADAYGNFESVDILVSSESTGRIFEFEVQEGDRVRSGDILVRIDTVPLSLQRSQLSSGQRSLAARLQTLDRQVEAQRIQRNNLSRELDRVGRMHEGGAATTKQLEDLEGQVALVDAQLAAVESQKSSVHAEQKTLELQLAQVEDQIARTRIASPIDGILLNRYKEAGELAAAGQPLFKVADLDTLILRAYVSGNQLGDFTLGQEVTVRVDAKEGLTSLAGRLIWVSSSAEFTPKVIQTRDERVSLVYAIKVEVPNDGRLKIGMPGEVMF